MNLRIWTSYRKAAVVLILLLLLAAVIVTIMQEPASDGEAVPDLTLTDFSGATFSLSDFRGNVTVLHITQLENPLCIECEEHMIGQIAELGELSKADNANISIVSLNIRKNPYSEDGWMIAEKYYGLNISWLWVEEFEPFPASSQFIRYWEVQGGFSNPTVILIDHELRVAGAFNVYCIGFGEIDGIIDASTLVADSKAILEGTWDYQFEDGDGGEAVTFGSLFLLGVVTSFSPCSIALLMAMISYIGALRDTGRPEETTDGQTMRGVMIGLAFTMGMALVFLLMGFMIAYIGGFIELSTVFYLLAGIVLMVLGVNSIKPLSTLLPRLGVRRGSLSGADACPAPAKGRIGRMARGMLLELGRRSRYASAFLLGMLFSVGWAPCALSLVFPVIVLVLAQQFTVLTGGLMMFAFGLGHGVVIVPFCAATGALKGRIGNKYVSAGRWIQLGFGVAIIAIGAIFALRYAGVHLW